MLAFVHSPSAASASRLWWLRLPLISCRVFPSFSTVLTDGFYLLAWPKIAALAPPLALVIGLIIGWLHPGDIYSFSIALLSLMVLICTFGAAVGIWLSLGYVLGDFFLHDHPVYRSTIGFTNFWAPFIIADMLLVVLLVIVPLATKSLRLRTRAELKPFLRARLIGDALLHAAIQGMLVYVWVQAFPTLIRPFYIWQRSTPPAEAIRPVQEHGWLLVLLATIGAIVRLILEYGASSRSDVVQQARDLQLAMSKSVQYRRTLPLWAATSLRVSFLTLMLSGMLTQWWEMLELIVMLFAVLSARAFLSRRMLTFVQRISRVPLIARLIGAVVLSYILTSQIVGKFWGYGESFQPIIISVVASLLVLSICVPDESVTIQGRA